MSQQLVYLAMSGLNATMDRMTRMYRECMVARDDNAARAVNADDSGATSHDDCVNRRSERNDVGRDRIGTSELVDKSGRRGNSPGCRKLDDCGYSFERGRERDHRDGF